jgi:hypothetical protein
MRFTKIIAAMAAPLALGGVLLSTTAASAATTASSASAYYWQPNGHALGGPQDLGQYPETVTFSSQYLAKVTEKVNNVNLNGATITITGHLNQSAVTYQGQGSDGITNPRIDARPFFVGTGGSDGSPTQLGFCTQTWWANSGSPLGVLDLTPTSVSQNGDFTLTATVSPSPGAWSDWDGQQASDSPTDATLFAKAASHVREVGLSFGGGNFFENGVTGSGSLTITSITITPTS